MSFELTDLDYQNGWITLHNDTWLFIALYISGFCLSMIWKAHKFTCRPTEFLVACKVSIVLYCTVLYCMYFTVLYCIYITVLYCSVLCVLYCIVLYTIPYELPLLYTSNEYEQCVPFRSILSCKTPTHIRQDSFWINQTFMSLSFGSVYLKVSIIVSLNFWNVVHLLGTS